MDSHLSFANSIVGDVVTDILEKINNKLVRSNSQSETSSTGLFTLNKKPLIPPSNIFREVQEAVHQKKTVNQ